MKLSASHIMTLLAVPSALALPAAISPNALAQPAESALHEALQNLTTFEGVRVGHSKRGSVPSYCRPIDQIDQMQPYTYFDMSDKCEANGIPAGCCVSILNKRPRGCPTVHTKELQHDLSFGLREQGRKDGLTKSTKRGPFLFTWADFFTTALRDQAVVSPWVSALVEYNRVVAVHSEDS